METTTPVLSIRIERSSPGALVDVKGVTSVGFEVWAFKFPVAIPDAPAVARELRAAAAALEQLTGAPIHAPGWPM